MKKGIYIFCLFAVLGNLFTCCNFHHAQPQTKPEDTVHFDSSQSVLNRTNKDSVTKKSSMDTFLLHPFDLYKFKKKKGSAQGGGLDLELILFNPAFKGFYWGYMMFPPVFQGYLGKDIKDTVNMENCFEMTTYRPAGNSKDRFNWDCPGEILIAVKAKYNRHLS